MYAKLTFGTVGLDVGLVTPLGKQLAGGHFNADERDLIGLGFDTNNNSGLLPFVYFTSWTETKSLRKVVKSNLVLSDINI